MKTLISLSVIAFSAVSALTNNADVDATVFGKTTTGACVTADNTEQIYCSETFLGPQCTVFVAGSILTGPPQSAPAYSKKNNAYHCINPLWRMY